MKKDQNGPSTILDALYPLLSQSELLRFAKFFQTELVAALSNQSSSLPTILNPIHRMVPKPGFGVVVSIGGTNGYASAFRISEKGVLSFLNRRSFSLPEQTTKSQLFRLMSENVFAVSGGRKTVFPIGIGFAYPLKPLIHHRFIDGELMYMAKGRNIEGLVGEKVGQEYHKYLIKEYGFDTTVSVANDAICLLLGGDGADIAGVIGTGLNFAYWERRQAIAPLKLSQLNNFSQGEVAVNIESKNFSKISGTPLRDEIDQKSIDPGYSLAEKEASGAYLFKIFNAGREQLLGGRIPELTSTDQLNEIITGLFEFPEDTSKETKQLTVTFAQRIFDRSAQIVALELCGVLSKIGKTKGIVPVVMEGGIFWKAKNYSSLVNLYINQILPEVIPSFARLFGSSRRGIAILARGTV